ncbi:MAG: hypothetical protein HYV09_20390 [Deltaproteobacteria bacterium]|nr:hypothetical protein [Deltaproteobacteria bacterium]
MTLDVDDRLRALLRVACEDALFAVAASSPAALSAFGERRAPVHEAIAREGLGHAVMIADGDAWLGPLVRTLVVDEVPWFLPMREAIDDGLTLLREPRGFRALIPVGVDALRARLRREAMLAVRVARTVAAADAPLGDDETRALDLLAFALGLADDDARVLRAEAPIPAAAIDVPDDLDARTARAIVGGAFQVAASDGLDEREREAITTIAGRLGLDAEAVSEIASRATSDLDRQHRVGRALVDVVRYVVAGAPVEEARALITAAVFLTIPPVHRADALRAASDEATTPLAESHELDRAECDRVLAAGWACALSLDSSFAGRAVLRARHRRAGTHLAAERRAEDARALVERWVDEVLDRGTAVLGA